ncbi:MAG: hypothetical protein Q4E89_10200 [Eubacteriales bacterium]|nr:hypothetical protein [Eubacteriales bacterium]
MAGRQGLSEEENRVFHLNYEYMWRKLSTTYYHVKNNTLDAQDIRGKEGLPSYTNLSKCINPKWTPSKGFVDKIVRFYNANILPEVDTHQFLTKDLSLTDEIRYRNDSVIDERFLGKYYGYYYAPGTRSKVSGAILKLFNEDRILKAKLLTGIQTDRQMTGFPLKQLFDREPLQKEDFDKYYQNLETDKQRCYYYEGTADMTKEAIIICFTGPDEEHRRLFLTLNVDCFTAGIRRPYQGGLAFVMTTGDGPFDAQFFQMGLSSAANKPFSLRDKRVGELLRIHVQENERIVLTSGMDRRWYELLLQERDIV